jgi:PAS domain S-box-containing protein
MPNFFGSDAFRRYAVAVAAIVLATGLRMMMYPLLEWNFPFATLFFAVIFVAWNGGFGPALLATLVGGIAAGVFLLPPSFNLAVEGIENQGGLALYLAVGLGISLIGGAMRNSQRRAELSARDAIAQREQLQVTLMSIGDAVISTDTRGRVTSMNPVAVDLTGWPVSEALTRPLAEVFHIINEETRRIVESPVDMVLAHGRIVGLANHTLLVSKDGTERPIDDSAAPIFDRSGKMIGVVLVFRDVTESRLATLELKRREEELADFFDNANVGLEVVGADGLIQRVNQAKLDLLGYEREEYIGRPVTDFHVDQKAIREVFERLQRGEKITSLSTRLRAKDGTTKDVLINSSGYFENGQFQHSRCFTLDITDRNRAATARALLASVVESSEDAIVTKTLEGIITSWNAGAERVFGHTADEAIGQSITLIIPPERQDEERQILERIRQGERIEHFDTIRLAKDGSRLEISVSISPVLDADGKIVGAAKVARNMTAHRRAERAARIAEERLELIADNVPALISYVDKTGCYRLNNRAYEVWFDLSRKDIQGRHMREVLGEEGWGKLRPYVETALQGQPVSFEDEVPYARGGKRWISGNYVPHFNEVGEVEGFAVLVNDITARKQTEDAMRENEERLRLALEAGQMGTWEWNIRSNQVIWSPGLEAIHGLAPGTFDGTFEAFQNDIHPDDRQRVMQQIERTLTDGEDHRIEYRLLLPYGATRWIEGRGKLFRDVDGQPHRMVGVCTDVTVRRDAEIAVRESEEKFRNLADNIAQLAWMADQSGWIFWYNQRWFDYTGTNLEEMQGWGWQKVQHPDYVDAVTEKFRAHLEQGIVWEDTFPLRGRDGNYRWFLSRAVPIRDERNDVLRWYGTNTDITDQRQAEEALRAADRRKDEFLATLAHELRNPLAPIRTSLEILKRANVATEMIEESRATMDRQLSHLQRLVDDLLDISRITRDRLELRKERIELASVIHQAVETCRPLAVAAQHELQIDLPEEPIYLHADPVRLAQVFSNLLNNSCKYTEAGGHIALTVKHEGNDVVVTVADDGIGLPPEMLPRVFEMFTQVQHGSTLSQGGLGIGLTLVRRLVELHDGSIEARSAGPGKGSEFIVRLPVIKAPVPVTPTAVKQSDSQSPKLKILVVDDNRDAAKMLSMLLKLSGHTTHLEHDGEAAVAAAESFRPDLVLLDLGLPLLSGHDAARRIRSQPWGQSMTLVALTGWGQDEDRRRSSEAGFNYHLVKPVDHAQLNELIATLHQHR